ncbi:putative serine esterase-domain-containing protein [Entophlyctis helioformis]|nr:putative serine esterase-domain-containing protein [Entophlyctis helioformis]
MLRSPAPMASECSPSIPSPSLARSLTSSSCPRSPTPPTSGSPLAALPASCSDSSCSTSLAPSLVATTATAAERRSWAPSARSSSPRPSPTKRLLLLSCISISIILPHEVFPAYLLSAMPFAQSIQAFVCIGQFTNIDVYQRGMYKIQCRLYKRSHQRSANGSGSKRIDGIPVRLIRREELLHHQQQQQHVHSRDIQDSWDAKNEIFPPHTLARKQCLLRNHRRCNWRCRASPESPPPTPPPKSTIALLLSQLPALGALNPLGSSSPASPASASTSSESVPQDVTLQDARADERDGDLPPADQANGSDVLQEDPSSQDKRRSAQSLKLNVASAVAKAPDRNTVVASSTFLLTTQGETISVMSGAVFEMRDAYCDSGTADDETCAYLEVQLFFSADESLADPDCLELQQSRTIRINDFMAARPNLMEHFTVTFDGVFYATCDISIATSPVDFALEPPQHSAASVGDSVYSQQPLSGYGQGFTAAAPASAASATSSSAVLILPVLPSIFGQLFRPTIAAGSPSPASAPSATQPLGPVSVARSNSGSPLPHPIGALPKRSATTTAKASAPAVSSSADSLRSLRTSAHGLTRSASSLRLDALASVPLHQHLSICMSCIRTLLELDGAMAALASDHDPATDRPQGQSSRLSLIQSALQSSLPRFDTSQVPSILESSSLGCVTSPPGATPQPVRNASTSIVSLTGLLRKWIASEQRNQSSTDIANNLHKAVLALAVPMKELWADYVASIVLHHTRLLSGMRAAAVQRRLECLCDNFDSEDVKSTLEFLDGTRVKHVPLQEFPQIDHPTLLHIDVPPGMFVPPQDQGSQPATTSLAPAIERTGAPSNQPIGKLHKSRSQGSLKSLITQSPKGSSKGSPRSSPRPSPNGSPKADRAKPLLSGLGAFGNRSSKVSNSAMAGGMGGGSPIPNRMQSGRSADHGSSQKRPPLKHSQVCLKELDNALKQMAHEFEIMMNPAPPSASPESAVDVEQHDRQLVDTGCHLIVFVHGLLGSSFDFRQYRNRFSSYLVQLGVPKSMFMLLTSTSYEDDTFQDIETMASRLASEVSAFINGQKRHIKTISFVCHSLGGIIARCALRKAAFQPLIARLHTFFTLASPHLSLALHQNTIINSVMGIYQTISRSKCIGQLTLCDHPDPRQTLLFQLASDATIRHFKRVIMFASKQDKYVPFEGALGLPQPRAAPFMVPPAAGGAPASAPSGTPSKPITVSTILAGPSLSTVESTAASTATANSSMAAIVQEMAALWNIQLVHVPHLRRYEVQFADLDTAERAGTLFSSDPLGRMGHLAMIEDPRLMDMAFLANGMHFPTDQRDGLPLSRLAEHGSSTLALVCSPDAADMVSTPHLATHSPLSLQ